MVVGARANRSVLFGLVVAALLAIAACSNSKPQPEEKFAAEVKVQPLVGGPATAVSAKVTLQKNEILNRDFLYSIVAQATTTFDTESEVTWAPSPVASQVVRFRIVGDNLQIVEHEPFRYRSADYIAHPLVFELPIESQTVTTLTVKFSQASRSSFRLWSDASAVGRASWIRNVESYTADGILMVESAVEGTTDGKPNGPREVTEFAEFIFPREHLTKKVVPPPFYGLGERSDAVLAARFGFDGSSRVWTQLNGKRVLSSIVPRLPYEPGKPIAWYVTRNIPAELVADVKRGIEGWNRHTRATWGKDLVEFKGLLPDGIRVGDPRYNVIAYDSLLDAGAAFADASVDQETGVKFGGVVYMPRFWLKKGRELGYNLPGVDRKPAAKARVKFPSERFASKSKCMKPVEQDPFEIGLVATGASQEDYGRNLFASVVMHEVGHVLGLDHNFAGSAGADPLIGIGPYSSSIMDYNLDIYEVGAFDDVNSSTGPDFAWDRQAISLLYGPSKTLPAKEPTLPFCSVAEATDEGVDPLCTSYDAGENPDDWFAQVFRLIVDNQAMLGQQHSLGYAIERITGEALGDPTLITTEAELKAALARIDGRLDSLVKFYMTDARQSVKQAAGRAVPLLRVYRPGIGRPRHFDEWTTRKHVTETLTAIFSLKGTPRNLTAALEKARKKTEAWLNRVPIKAAAEEEKSLIGRFAHVAAIIAGDQLSEVRTAVLEAMALNEKVPFASNSTIDYEAAVVDLLKSAVLGEYASGVEATDEERLVAAKSLASFASLENTKPAMSEAMTAVQNELKTTVESDRRTQLRDLLKALKGGG